MWKLEFYKGAERRDCKAREELILLKQGREEHVKQERIIKEPRQNSYNNQR